MNLIVKETIDRCRAAGLRRTKALEELITTLLESKRPMTLSELATSKRLTDQCDKATVFRLLQRLRNTAWSGGSACTSAPRISPCSFRENTATI